jgi:hypothetical protein
VYFSPLHHAPFVSSRDRLERLLFRVLAPRDPNDVRPARAAILGDAGPEADLLPRGARRLSP